jgi:hypothetical protein
MNITEDGEKSQYHLTFLMKKLKKLPEVYKSTSACGANTLLFRVKINREQFNCASIVMFFVYLTLLSCIRKQKC